MQDDPHTLQASDLTPHRLINRRQLRTLLPVSDMSVWRYERDGVLPKHVTIGGRCFWRFAEVIEALARLGQGAVK